MIYIDRESSLLLYEQIYRQIKDGIESEDMRQGTKLPGIRSLAKTLGVARNTVEKAYTQLSVEGYIYPKAGSGYLVDDWERGAGKKEKIRNIPAVIKTETTQSGKNIILYDFQYGDFPEYYFPAALWKKYTVKALFSAAQPGIQKYQDKQGNLSLRQELRNYLHQSRGVSCEESQIVIGCGLHHSLDILCKIFRDNKNMAMEEPGYYGVREAFQNNEISLRYLPAGKNGLDLHTLETMDVSAVYVTPSHQFPLGTVMTIAKRRRLLKWAVENKAYIIEDDYDSEYRYDANPVPSLQSLDEDSRVIYIGTFSKSLSPSLRVNYMVLPKQLLAVYHQMFSSYASPVSWLTQEVLAEYLASGRYLWHVRKMCAAYRRKQDVLIQELTGQFGKQIRLHGKGAGLHFILEFPKGTKASDLIRRAREAGVLVYSVEPFWGQAGRCPQNLLFMGYSLLDEQEIREGVRILYQVWKKRISR